MKYNTKRIIKKFAKKYFLQVQYYLEDDSLGDESNSPDKNTIENIH